MKMDRRNFLMSFRNACKIAHRNECVKWISESGTKTVTFQEMERDIEEMSNRFEPIILRDECVGIICDDLRPQIIAIMMAILERQATFVFLHPHSPRLKSDVERLNIRVLVCEESTIRDCMAALEDVVIKDDLLSSSSFKHYKILECDNNNAFPSQISIDQDIAFVAFSSGSTGQPKIIRVPFPCIMPNILDLRNIYKIRATDTIYVSTPPTFDPCILDIFLALSSGCSLLFVAKSVKFETETVSNIFANVVTVCYMTPSVFLNTFPRGMESTSLRILILGGERFPRLDSSVYPCLKRVNVYNIYGITEVSCWASINLVVESNADSSLGTPLSDTIFEVRNNDGNIITDGAGELFIGSSKRICVMGHDDSSEKPCFRASGDVVEVKDGKYFYVGRTDRRIKIFGHRVNLASIDAELAEHSIVKHCHSIFDREENIIVVFIVPVNDDIAVEAFESLVKFQFPYRMFKVLRIPLNEHGKVDEDACSNLYRSLKNRLDKNIVREFESLWKKYTSRTSDDDLGFVESGGNSILALQFTTALSNVGHVPSDFVVALLSNVKYSACRELISQRVNEVQPTNYKRPLDKVEDDEENSSKKIKSELSFGHLERVLGRGNREINAINSEDDHSAVSVISGNMKVRWKHNMVKCIDASPMVFVYEKITIVVCGSHSGQILFVDVTTGDILTKMELPDRIESSACSSSCGKFIFLGCYDHNVYCINVPTGTIEWTFVTGDMVKSTPVYLDEKLYFGSYDHFFYCISWDGQLLWKTNIDESSIYASAIVGQNIATATLGGTVAFLDHEGCILFSHNSGKPLFSSPFALSRDVCVTIDVSGVVRTFNMISGEQMWQNQVDGNVFSSISCLDVGDSKANKIVFGCHDKYVYCYDVDDSGANLCWRLKVHSPIYATPFCFRYGDRALVCVATTSGGIYIVNMLDGAIIKSSTMEADVFSSPVVVGSTAIFGCRNNYLYALDIS